MGVIGELVVKITGQTTQLDSSIDKSRKKLEAFSKSAVQLGKRLTLAVTLPIIGLGVAFVKAASDAEETQQKFDVVFGEFAETTKKWNEEYSKSVGRSRVENLAFLASVQDLFVPLGFARKEATEMSKSVVKLATDVASFNNLRTQDVLRDIQGALVGMHITVRKYGVLLNEASINQELLNMGVKGGFKAATDMEKAQARLNVIFNSTTDAQDDATRTVDSFANQMRALQADTLDVAEAFGTLMIPVLKDVIEVVRGALDAILSLDDSTKRTILTITAIAAAIGPAIFIIGGLIKAIIALKVAMLALSGPVGLVVAALALVAGGLILMHRRTQDVIDSVKNQTIVIREAKKEIEDYKKVFEDRLLNMGESAEELTKRIIGIDKAIISVKEEMAKLQEEPKAGEFVMPKFFSAEQGEAERVEAERTANRIRELENKLTELIAARQVAATQLAKDEGEKRVDDVEKETEDTKQAYFDIHDLIVLENKQFSDRMNKQAADRATAEEEAQERIRESARVTAQLREDLAFNTLNTMIDIAGSLKQIWADNAVAQKQLAIFQAVIGTAVAIVEALKAPWPFSLAAAALAGVRGAAQIAAINATELPAMAEGGVFSGAAIVGEGGPEVALPLTDEVFSRLASAIEEARPIENVFSPIDKRPINLNLSIGSKELNAYINSESRNGRIRIDRKRGITK